MKEKNCWDENQNRSKKPEKEVSGGKCFKKTLQTRWLVLKKYVFKTVSHDFWDFSSKGPVLRGKVANFRMKTTIFVPKMPLVLARWRFWPKILLRSKITISVRNQRFWTWPRKLKLIYQRRWCEKLDFFAFFDIFWPWLDLENLFLIIIKIKSNGSQ